MCIFEYCSLFNSNLDLYFLRIDCKTPHGQIIPPYMLRLLPVVRSYHSYMIYYGEESRVGSDITPPLIDHHTHTHTHTHTASSHHQRHLVHWPFAPRVYGAKQRTHLSSVTKASTLCVSVCVCVCYNSRN